MSFGVAEKSWSESHLQEAKPIDAVVGSPIYEYIIRAKRVISQLKQIGILCRKGSQRAFSIQIHLLFFMGDAN